MVPFSVFQTKPTIWPVIYFQAVFSYFSTKKKASNPKHVVKRLPITESHPSELTTSAQMRRDEGAFDQISKPVSRSVVGCPLSRRER